MDKHIRANVVILVSIPIIIIVTAIFIWALQTNARVVEKNVQLTKEVQTLNAEIDRLKNEPQILFSKAHDEKKANKYDSALAILKELQHKYPDFQPDIVSAAIADFTLTKDKFQKEQEEKKRIQESDKERVAREREKAIEEATGNLVKSRDEIKEIEWYYDKTNLEKEKYAWSKYICTYIGKKNDQVWLRFKMYYGSVDWLFVKSALFKVDGENFELTYDLFDDWERNNDGSNIQEWKDVLVNIYIWNLINKIAKSEKAMMRYEGQHQVYDQAISTEEKVALKNILLAYQAMGGKPPTK
jgi:outer membrane murein-binding lipoprotein Lpp